MLAETKQNTFITIILITGMVVFVHNAGLWHHWSSCVGGMWRTCLSAQIICKRRITV